MEEKRAILDRVKEMLWNFDSDDTDDNTDLVFVSDNDSDQWIVEDETDGRFYRVDNTDYEKIEDGDIIEVKPYKVICTRYR